MQTAVATHIEFRPSRIGHQRAYIAGTRVRVQDVYAMCELRGLSPDEVVDELPQLSLGQVYAALSYYFDHREEIVAEMRADEAYAESVRRQMGPGPLEQ
jgi:uncharacterized protein (DUF433 family)